MRHAADAALNFLIQPRRVGMQTMIMSKKEQTNPYQCNVIVLLIQKLNKKEQKYIKFKGPVQNLATF